MSKNQDRRVRNAYAVSTISVTLVLFLLGSAIYFIMNATKATDSIIGNVKVSLAIKDNTTKQQRSQIDSILSGSQFVEKVEFISKEQAAENFQKFLGEDLIVDADINPLPATYDIYLKKDADKAVAVDSILLSFKSKSYVDELIHQSSQIDRVVKTLTNFKLVMFIFGVAFLFVSIVLVNNTIRMNVFAKRFLIRSMLLIGATYGFIRRPFIKNAVIQGFVSALFAFIMLLLLIIGINRSIPEVEIIINDYQKYLMIASCMFVIGIILCVLSTIVSVNKYLKLRNDDMHVY